MLLSPIHYGVFLQEDRPTQAEALKMIDDYVMAPILDEKTKTVVYKYLQYEGLQAKADEVMQKTSDKRGKVSEFDEIMKKIVTSIEKFAPKEYDGKNEERYKAYKREFDHKLAMAKKLAGL